jgi:hypothetical protein
VCTLCYFYSVQLTYTAYGEVAKTSTATVQFVSSDSTKAPPPVPITDVEDPYYNVFSYNAFILMINTAIETAWGNFADQTPPVVTPVGATAPFLSWDSGGNLAILTILTSLTTETVGNGVLKVAFNTPLYTLFSSFNAVKYRDPTDQSVYYQLVVDTGPSAVISSEVVTEGGTTTTIYSYQVIQEYTTCPLWTPVDSIVFTTSMIPINPELTAAPVVYTNNKVFQSIGTNANLTNVLTDFIVDLVTGTEYKPVIYYVPSGEYRMTSLFGTNPASSIQVNVYYKNRFGTLVPITLGFGCSASIKILFRRRDFSNIILD